MNTKNSDNAEILFFSRKYNIDSVRFNTNSLPSNIRFHVIPTKKFKHGLFYSALGLSMHLRNKLNKPCSKKQKDFFRKHLLSFADVNFENANDLVVFQEQTPVARLFIQNFASYTAIEDGYASYIHLKKSGIEKIYSYITGKPSDYVLAENDRCIKNIVLFPDKIPCRVKDKTVGLIINDEVRTSVLFNFFNCKYRVNPNEKTILLITQPIVEPGQDHEHI
ncbi:MAG: hypothetical protein R3Y10_00585, partial [Ferrimonas sp.]